MAHCTDPGVHADAENCIHNALQRAGAGQVDSTGTICIQLTPLLRFFKLLCGDPGSLVSRRVAKTLLKAHPQPLAELLSERLRSE